MERLKDIKIDIDLSAIKEEMEKLQKDLHEKKYDLHEIKNHAKKYKYFMSDLREELEKDGVIEDADEDFDMHFNEDEMEINGSKVDSKLHEKYKKMYEERFGPMKGSIHSSMPH